MINTENSKKDHSGSRGDILRDSAGDHVVAAKGGGPPISVTAHELQGVEMGLTLERTRGFKKVHFAIDSMVVYYILINKEEKPPWQLLQIWRRVNLLREFFDVLKISHVYRETNRDANLLASHHPPIKWMDVRTEDFSAELHQIIKEDTDGTQYRRSYSFLSVLL
ncbi:uncharacterized protein LOC113360749 [Papaver somniferum]|uniref:uncharacterized protein LOC113360749 n=1 Tax=Papaver somniferum TaxID=3469 RepID=UPI000E6F5944|nr:uncharacterized protein LOC113360749 [Papaver somniferum]